VRAFECVRPLRRLAVPCRLALARVRRRGGSMLLAGLGVAAAAAALATVLAASLVAQDRSLARRLGELPDASRAVRAVWLGVPGRDDERYAALDAAARTALRDVPGERPVGTVLFRESTIAGTFVGLGAVDGLRPWIRLRSGRLPRACRPERCEVVRVRGTGRIPNARGLRLRVVGTGELRSGALFGDAIPPERSARGRAQLSPSLQRAGRYHQPALPSFVLAEGVAGLAASPLGRRVYRSYGWVVPLDAGVVHPWSAQHVVAASERARSRLATASSSFEVAAPVEELLAARRDGRVAGRRLLLLGGEAAALLLAFAALAGTRMRRDLGAAFGRLTWLGARRWQLAALALAEAALVAAPAALAGWGLAALLAAVVARRAGSPAGDVLRSSLLSPGGLALAVLVALMAALTLVVAATVRPARLRGIALSPLDVAAVGAVVLVAAILARGEADPAALARERGTGTLLLLVPGLIAFAAAVATARLLAPLLRALERAVPGRWVWLRLAALSLARNPGHAAVAAAFLVVSVGLGLFAQTYRETLTRAHAEQAAFAVPADAILREDLARLIPVRDVATPVALRRLRPGVATAPVTRLGSSLSGLAGATSFTVLGLDRATLAGIDGWRSDFAAESPARLAARLGEPVPEMPNGPRLPVGAQRLAVRATTSGPRFGLSASIQIASGDVALVELGRTRSGAATVLAAAIPRVARGGTVVSLRVLPPPRIFEAGADSGRAARGTLRLGPLLADGRPAGSYDGWLAGDGIEAGTTAGGVALRLSLTSRTGSPFRPRQATDGRALPALVSPALAALADDDRELSLRVAGEPVLVRVAGTVERVPGVSGDAVVVERSQLVTALNASRPGVGFATEVWLNGADPAILARRPFDVLRLDSQDALRRRLASEPIARGSLALLAAVAATALALALVSLVLGALAELRDARGELHELEAQGVTPARLRAQLRLRALAVALAGVLGGVVAGIVLARVVVRLVALTAGATLPDPPLRLALELQPIAVALALTALLATVLVTAVAAAAFRGRTAGRPPEGGA
jgi:hypothetical protein